MSSPQFEFPTPPPPPGPPAKPPLYKRRWAQLVGTGFLAFTLGAGSASSGSETDTVKADLAASQTQSDSLRSQLDAANKRASEAEAAASKAKGDAEAALKDRVTTAEAKLKERADQLNAQDAALREREKAVGIAEANAEANSFDGDGTYLVGTDIQPGIYKAADNGDCYWARLKDSAGMLDSIIENNVGSGPQVINVQPGDFAVEVSGCGTFTKAN